MTLIEQRFSPSQEALYIPQHIIPGIFFHVESSERLRQYATESVPTGALSIIHPRYFTDMTGSRRLYTAIDVDTAPDMGTWQQIDLSLRPTERGAIEGGIGGKIHENGMITLGAKTNPNLQALFYSQVSRMVAERLQREREVYSNTPPAIVTIHTEDAKRVFFGVRLPDPDRI